MSKFFEILSNHSEKVQIAEFFVVFFFFWNLENIFGLSKSYKKWRHASVNFPFIFTSVPAEILLGIAFVKVINWDTANNFGFLHQLPLDNHPVLLFLASFIFLDFGEYVYHYLAHKVKPFWLFHAIHHSDKKMDVSTTLREHPGDNFVRLSLTLLWVFLSGTLFWVLILRQIIQMISSMFSHFNYRIPEKTDRALRLLINTPNFHLIHHHYKMPLTDSNYGDVLTIWDRLFGTYRDVQYEKVIVGLDFYQNDKDVNDFSRLFILPFTKIFKKEYYKQHTAKKKVVINQNVIIENNLNLINNNEDVKNENLVLSEVTA